MTGPSERVVVGAAAVVEQGASYLMLQRGGPRLGLASDGHGEWAFPGGWLEHGETAQDAARRECEEETGVIVRPGREDGYTVNQAPSGLTVVTLFVRCEYVSGEPINAEPEKALAVRWMDRAFLVELDLFAPLDSWWRRGR